ncbi:ferredoxin reductase family protein [Pseudonocardia zijingensis]|uniref:Ferredoxin reductase family protein n=1 Tax=Pseudonocardia zijingensis TaxID=153376 RepID=A0ABP4AMS1_9PSEU
MKRLAARAAWAVALVTLPAVPLVILVRLGGGNVLAVDIPVLLGVLAVVALAATVVVSSRVRALTKELGIEQILRVHRWCGLAVLGLVLAHVAAVVLRNPAKGLAYLDLVHASPTMRSGTIATLAFVLLTVTSVMRRRLRLTYGFWRIVHVALAATALAGSAVHVVLLDNLIHADGMGIWFTAVTGSLVAVLVARWAVRPLQSGFRVLRVRRESGDVSTLVLAPTGDGPLSRRRPLTFAPGQFAWLRLRRWGLFADHPFTIASAVRADGTVEFTVRHVGDYTHKLGRLSPAARVYLDGPHGAFSVDNTHATGLVLLAGGVGITPMISMLRTLADRGDRRPHRLLVSGRTPEDLLFADELRELQERLHLTVVPTLTQPHPAWRGPIGRIDADMLTAVLPGPFRRNQLDYFLCGSPPFVDGMVSTLDDIGIPRQRMHTEQFETA